jgi:GDPmannose 4,6-dehydratase
VTLGVARIKRAYNNNENIIPIELGNLDSVRSWQFAGDVADAIWKSLNNPKGPIDYVVSASYSNTIKELVERAFAYGGLGGYWQNDNYVLNNGVIVVRSTKDNFRPSDVTFLQGDSTRIRADLGWQSTLNFESLIERMVNYDLNNPNQ